MSNLYGIKECINDLKVNIFTGLAFVLLFALNNILKRLEGNLQLLHSAAIVPVILLQHSDGNGRGEVTWEEEGFGKRSFARKFWW